MQLEREHEPENEPEHERERERATYDERQRAGGSPDAFPAVNAWSPASSTEPEPEPERAPTAESDQAVGGRSSDPASDDSFVPESAAAAANGGAPDTTDARSKTTPATSASPSDSTSASSSTSSSSTRSAAVSRRSQAVSDSFEDLFADTTPWPSWREEDAPDRRGSSPSAGSRSEQADAESDGTDDADFTFDILGDDPHSAHSASGDSVEEQSSGVLVSGSNDERDGDQSRERPAQSSNDGLFAGLADERGDSTEDSSRGTPGGSSRGTPGGSSRGTPGGASHGASSSVSRDTSTRESSSGTVEREVVRQVRRVLESADAVTLGMLVRYRRQGPLAPEDAHVAAGGDGDRTKAYSRNSTLRQAGLVTHAGRGRYEYALRELVERTHDDRLSPGRVDAIVEQIEDELLLSPLDA